MLSVPENEIPYEAWVQFHHSVQVEDLVSHGLQIETVEKNKVVVT